MNSSFGKEPPPKRVYDADQVDAYIADLQGELDALRNVPPRPATISERDWQTAASLLGRAIITAQRTADEVLDDAEARARAIISEAERQAREIAATRPPSDRPDETAGDANGNQAFRHAAVRLTDFNPDQ